MCATECSTVHERSISELVTLVSLSAVLLFFIFMGSHCTRDVPTPQPPPHIITSE